MYAADCHAKLLTGMLSMIVGDTNLCTVAHVRIRNDLNIRSRKFRGGHRNVAMSDLFFRRGVTDTGEGT